MMDVDINVQNAIVVSVDNDSISRAKLAVPGYNIP